MSETRVQSQDILDGTITDTDVASANKDGSSGTASMRTLGTGSSQAAAGNHDHSGVYQPLDSDLTAIAALAPSNDDIVQRKAGAWTNRSISQLSSDLGLGSLATLSAVDSAHITDGTIASGDLSSGLITSLSGGGAWTVVTKGTDTSRSSTSSLAADSDTSVALTFTPASGGVYQIEALLIYASPAGGGTPDFKLSFGEDATARGSGHVICMSNGDAAATTNFLMQNANGVSIGTAATNRMCILRGWYVGTGNAASIYWSQLTSDTNATILRASSILAYRRIL